MPFYALWSVAHPRNQHRNNAVPCVGAQRRTEDAATLIISSVMGDGTGSMAGRTAACRANAA